jgi:spermidine/putrescine-binding protein
VGTLILADPRQSGSIATTLDAILNATVWNAARAQGWDGALREAMAKESKDKTPWEKSLSPEHLALAQEAFASGWRLLREMTANTRGYTAAATKPPIDISAGEGAAGLAIDFYGRSQAQFVLAEGEEPTSGRVGYVDPKGSAYIDADPVSMLRGGPDPELAKRFIEFCLTEEAQLLWQLPSQRSSAGKSNPMVDGIASGPRRYELRRMPVRRDVYASFGEGFIDKVDPFQIAANNRPVGWRDVMRDMFGAFAVDNADLQRAAWKSLQRARAGSVSPETLAQMEQAFYAWPVTTVSVKQADGEATRQELEFHVSTIRAIRGVRADRAAWPRVEIAWTTFFRDQYKRVIELGRSGR